MPGLATTLPLITTASCLPDMLPVAVAILDDPVAVN